MSKKRKSPSIVIQRDSIYYDINGKVWEKEQMKTNGGEIMGLKGIRHESLPACMEGMD